VTSRQGAELLTPLEAATTVEPRQDREKFRAGPHDSRCARHHAPASGPGHLGLFGYDPLEFQVGRGVIEALGLGDGTQAGRRPARAPFCDADEKEIVTDAAPEESPRKSAKNWSRCSRKIKKNRRTEVIIKRARNIVSSSSSGKGLEGRDRRRPQP